MKKKTGSKVKFENGVFKYTKKDGTVVVYDQKQYKCRRREKFRDKYIFVAYDIIKDGMSANKVAEIIGTRKVVIDKWRKENDYFNLAFVEGAKLAERSKKDQLLDFVYNNAPVRVKKVMDKLHVLMKSTSKKRYEKIRGLLSMKSLEIQKHTFLHLWVYNGFNISNALSTMGMTKKHLDTWCEDNGFLNLLKEIEYHKKNYFEGKLMELVEGGNPQAIMMVNRTYNADRGYVEKIEKKQQTDVSVEHTYQIQWDKLNIPVDVKMQVLEALEEYEQSKLENKTIDVKQIGVE